MYKATVFFALFVALIGMSAAQFRVKRQTFTASVSPSQASFNAYNPYDPYNSYNAYNSYNPYRAPFQNQLYPGLPGQSAYPGQRAQPALAPQ